MHKSSAEKRSQIFSWSFFLISSHDSCRHARCMHASIFNNSSVYTGARAAGRNIKQQKIYSDFLLDTIWIHIWKKLYNFIFKYLQLPFRLPYYYDLWERFPPVSKSNKQIVFNLLTCLQTLSSSYHGHQWICSPAAFYASSEKHTICTTCKWVLKWSRWWSSSFKIRNVKLFEGFTISLFSCFCWVSLYFCFAYFVQVLLYWSRSNLLTFFFQVLRYRITIILLHLILKRVLLQKKYLRDIHLLPFFVLLCCASLQQQTWQNTHKQKKKL